MSKSSIIAFKGNREGLSIYLNADIDFVNLKDQLINKIESARLFFSGAKVISIQGKILSLEEKEEIKNIISSQYGMIMDERESSSENPMVHEVSPNMEDDLAIEIIDEGKTKFYRMTIRSGQIVRFDGNIVIIGDVNPGGEVIADGNIIVMGCLRGMAHAGAKGNDNAYVVAFSLLPTQLRIANVISRPPDNDHVTPSIPELAMVKNNTVVIEPYLPKRQ